LEHVALYELLSSLVSFEGDGKTVYRCDAEPDVTTVVRNKPVMAVLDDEESMHDLLREDLGDEGYEVIAFGRKDEFLCHIKHHPRMVLNLVISDLVAPGMDGLEFLRRFKSDPRRCDVPVIIVSGNAMKYWQQAIEYGAYICIAKPSNPDTLIKVVNQLMECERRRTCPP
jgi:CheY-like chemotaxis protein